MPYQSLRKCTQPGCNELVRSGRCAAHARQQQRIYRDPAVKSLYNDPRWQVLRANQLAKSPWCVDCLRQNYHVFATEVDHIQPHGGDPVLFFDENNLQSLCKSHHSSKTAREVWHGGGGGTPPT